MTVLPGLTGRQLVSVLKKAGFEVLGSQGQVSILFC